MSANPISDQPGCVCHFCRYERPKLERSLAELKAEHTILLELLLDLKGELPKGPH